MAVRHGFRAHKTGTMFALALLSSAFNRTGVSHPRTASVWFDNTPIITAVLRLLWAPAVEILRVVAASYSLFCVSILLVLSCKLVSPSAETKEYYCYYNHFTFSLKVLWHI